MGTVGKFDEDDADILHHRHNHLAKVFEVQNMLNAIPEVVTNGLNIAGGMIVVVGYAMVINMMRAGYLMPFFYLGFVTAAFTNFNLVALGVIGTVMAVLYIQLSPKYNRVAGAPAQAAGNNDLDNELD